MCRSILAAVALVVVAASTASAHVTLERRQATRTLGRRFRRDPLAYLQALEQVLINQALPP